MCLALSAGWTVPRMLAPTLSSTAHLYCVLVSMTAPSVSTFYQEIASSVLDWLGNIANCVVTIAAFAGF